MQTQGQQVTVHGGNLAIWLYKDTVTQIRSHPVHGCFILTKAVWRICRQLHDPQTLKYCLIFFSTKKISPIVEEIWDLIGTVLLVNTLWNHRLKQEGTLNKVFTFSVPLSSPICLFCWLKAHIWTAPIVLGMGRHSVHKGSIATPFLKSTRLLRYHSHLS